MKVWYDTEFLDDGRLIDLISIGMVREDGAEYYAINAQMPWVRILQHDWLVENVVNHLPKTKYGVSLDHEHPDVKPHHVIKNEVEQFLWDGLKPEHDNVELWSWCGAYDHVALCQLWGAMVDKPFFIPHFTNEIGTLFHINNEPKINVPEGNHNALADAHYHKKLYEAILSEAKKQYKEDVLLAMHPEIGHWCPEGHLHKD